MNEKKAVSKQDLPRERLIHEGAEKLANHELLAILLRTGTKEETVHALSRRVLQQFESLLHIKEATIEELAAIKGIGHAKAVQLKAAFELGKRMSGFKVAERFAVRSPQDVARFVMDEMRFLMQEHFVALYLNTKNQVLHKQTVFIGSLNASIVHPREVFREAYRRSAASIICIHNHPSGVRLYGKSA